MDFTIRDARSDDAPRLAGYNAAMAAETEGKALDPDCVGPGVEALLADQSMGRYWVAEKGGNIVGQIMVTYEWSDWRNGMIWWIQSVYVHPEWRRQGVFSALYRHVESLAASTPGVIGLRLYVDAGNTRARQTYETLGMVRSDYRVMETLFAESPNDSET